MRGGLKISSSQIASQKNKKENNNNTIINDSQNLNDLKASTFKNKSMDSKIPKTLPEIPNNKLIKLAVNQPLNKNKIALRNDHFPNIKTPGNIIIAKPKLNPQEKIVPSTINKKSKKEEEKDEMNNKITTIRFESDFSKKAIQEEEESSTTKFNKNTTTRGYDRDSTQIENPNEMKINNGNTKNLTLINIMENNKEIISAIENHAIKKLLNRDISDKLKLCVVFQEKLNEMLMKKKKIGFNFSHYKQATEDIINSIIESAKNKQDNINDSFLLDKFWFLIIQIIDELELPKEQSQWDWTFLVDFIRKSLVEIENKFVQLNLLQMIKTSKILGASNLTQNFDLTKIEKKILSEFLLIIDDSLTDVNVLKSVNDFQLKEIGKKRSQKLSAIYMKYSDEIDLKKKISETENNNQIKLNDELDKVMHNIMTEIEEIIPEINENLDSTNKLGLLKKIKIIFANPTQEGLFSITESLDKLFKKYNMNIIPELSQRIAITKSTLEILRNLVIDKKNKTLIYDCIKSGRFDKNYFKTAPNILDHSIIFGRDGGLYMLLNSIKDSEISILYEDAVDLKSYFNNKFKPTTKINSKKIVIGQGGLGKIRLALVLSSPNSGLIKLNQGDLICVKKTKCVTIEDPLKPLKDDEDEFDYSDIRKNTLNDYYSEIIGKYIYSPLILDMNIINCSNLKHCKGYTMQEFFPIEDGTIFTNSKNPKFSEVKKWKHQKSYFLDIFQAISELLDKGYAMTDLKPGNTLYDVTYKSAKIIDLAGAVHKNNRSELERCKVQYISELTKKYTAPEILKIYDKKEKEEEEKKNKPKILNNQEKAKEEEKKKNENDDIVDLPKALSYSLGLMLREIVVLGFKEDNKILKKVEILMKELMTLDVKERISIEKGLEKLKEIGDIIDNSFFDFGPYIVNIKRCLENDFELFGLKKEIEEISRMNLQTLVCEIDPEKNEINDDVETEEICIAFDNFLNNQNKNSNCNVFLLLGSAGTGKSTVLQLKYWDLVKNWKSGDPMPFYMNLATGIKLKEKWKNFTKNIPGGEKLSLDLFIGTTGLKLTLLLDSYDESRSKSNLIKKYMDLLQRNENVKIIITCRSNYISNEKEEASLFKSKHNTYIKRYIVPMGPNYDFKSLIKKYVSSKIRFSISTDKCFELMEHFNLKEMMTTNLMTFMVLDVLPILANESEYDNSITSFDIYRYFSYKTIDKEKNKIPPFLRDKFKSDFNINEEGETQFYIDFATDLAIELHVGKTSSIHNFKSQAFFSKYKFNFQKSLKNQSIFNLIHILNLNCEIQDNSKVVISFPHETMKNYYLVKKMCSEFLNDNSIKTITTFSLRNFVKDINLIILFTEVVRNDNDLMEKLKDYVLGKMKQGSKKEDELDKIDHASSNAITILIGAHISFFEEDLSYVCFQNADIRDGVFTGCDFSYANLTEANMSNCKLERCIFKETNLSNIKLGVFPQIKKEGKIICLDVWQKKSRFASRESSLNVSPEGSPLSSIDMRRTIEEKSFWIVTGMIDDQKRIGSIELNEIYSGESYTPEEIILNFGAKKVNTINCVCFAPNGLRIACGTNDNDIRIWKKRKQKWSDEKKPIHLKEHTKSVNSLKFSSDSNFLVSGSNDKTIIIWSFEEKKIKKLYVFDEHKDFVNCVSFSPLGNYILSGSKDKTIKLWSKEVNWIQKSIITLNDHKDSVICIEISDFDYFISGSLDNSIIIWNSEFKSLRVIEDIHILQLNSICFSPDGNLIASCSKDKSIKLWDKTTGRHLRTFEGHSDSVNYVRFSIHGNTIISCSSDKSIRFWDKNTGKIKNYDGHSNMVHSIIYSYDGRTILSGSRDNTVKLWDVSNGKLIRTFIGHEKAVITVGYFKNRPIIFSGGRDKKLKLWNINNGNLIKDLDSSYGSINSVHLSADEKYIVAGSTNKCLIIWESDEFNIIDTVMGHKYYVNSVKFAPLSKDNSIDYTLISGSSDCSIRMWNKNQADKWIQGCIIGTHKSSVYAVDFSPDGNLIVSGGDDFLVKLWNRGGYLIKSFSEHSDFINCVTFSPDGLFILSGSSDKTIKFWNVNSKELFYSYTGNYDIITADFSKDGISVAIGSQDIYFLKRTKSLKYWNIERIICKNETEFRATGMKISKSILSGINQTVLEQHGAQFLKN